MAVVQTAWIPPTQPAQGYKRFLVPQVAPLVLRQPDQSAIRQWSIPTWSAQRVYGVNGWQPAQAASPPAIGPNQRAIALWTPATWVSQSEAPNAAWNQVQTVMPSVPYPIAQIARQWTAVWPTQALADFPFPAAPANPPPLAPSQQAIGLWAPQTWTAQSEAPNAAWNQVAVNVPFVQYPSVQIARAWTITWTAPPLARFPIAAQAANPPTQQPSQAAVRQWSPATWKAQGTAPNAWNQTQANRPWVGYPQVQIAQQWVVSWKAPALARFPIKAQPGLPPKRRPDQSPIALWHTWQDFMPGLRRPVNAVTWITYVAPVVEAPIRAKSKRNPIHHERRVDIVHREDRPVILSKTRRSTKV